MAIDLPSFKVPMHPIPSVLTAQSRYPSNLAIFSLAGGQLPRAGYVKGFPADKDTSYLVEVQYKYPVNKNISITPALYTVFNPNHNNSNDTVYVGVVRTTFSF